MTPVAATRLSALRAEAERIGTVTASLLLERAEREAARAADVFALDDSLDATLADLLDHARTVGA